MKYFLVILLSVLSYTSFSQSTINGLVKDEKGEPIFAVNVYLKSFPQKGTTTDFNGNFNLIIDDLGDTLLVSYIGYETKEILLSTVDFSKPLIIVLNKNSQNLEEVIIKASDPISEKFSVVKMKKMDIYLNPISQGDPLKAITVLPASTTTDETANPSLRGSSSDRTRVMLNRVPPEVKTLFIVNFLCFI